MTDNTVEIDREKFETWVKTLRWVALDNSHVEEIVEEMQEELHG